jgi:hypothetical protein
MSTTIALAGQTRQNGATQGIASCQIERSAEDTEHFPPKTPPHHSSDTTREERREVRGFGKWSLAI